MLALLNTWAQNKTDGIKDREYWLSQLDKIARPVLGNLAKDELKKNMPVLLSKRSDNPAVRKNAAYLEAFARLLSGMGPWLNQEAGSAKEQALRNEYRQLATSINFKCGKSICERLYGMACG